MKCQRLCGLLFIIWPGLLFALFFLQSHAWAADSGAVLVPAGSAWKYLDTGQNLYSTWRSVFYNDTAWAAGKAPLGYGESLVATTVSYGSDPDNKYITTYFRQAFNVPDATAFNRLFLRVLRDDGLIVYLNGAEIFRNNMPSGAVNYQTFASTNVYGPAERTYYTASFASSLLTGTNILAVELHQAGADSLDLDFDLELAASNVLAITRGPYLQIGTPTSIIVRWRTDSSGNSRVRYGLDPAGLNFAADDPAYVTEHEVHLSDLAPDTKYYYSIGTPSQTLAGGPDFFFITAPPNGKPTRIWVTGDTRTGDTYQAAVRDAYYQFAGNRYTDLWLMLGDDGGIDGSDAGFSQCLFDFFPEMLRQTVLWPCIGNHETYSGSGGMPYLNFFTLPTAGEAGGVASGIERYYSFDYGNIHFVVLDSVTSDISTDGSMYSWLQSDLAATSRDWLIAFWHYPPYSKGGHDSDSEGGMIQMRENFLPLLESYGVDLVLCGHSHTYERSYLLDGYYGYSWDFESDFVLNSGSGRPADSGVYVKSDTGIVPHQGTVYVVAGSSGLTSGGSLDHPAMFLSENQMGSLVLDIEGTILQAKFLRDTGAIDDYFTIIKGTPSNPIRVSQCSAQDGTFTLSWNAVPGRYYQVERLATLDPASAWDSVSDIILATEITTSWTDYAPLKYTAFYRVAEVSN